MRHVVPRDVAQRRAHRHRRDHHPRHDHTESTCGRGAGLQCRPGGRLRRQIADAGDEIGNHTWTHQILTEIEPAKAREELALTQDAIERITGRKPTLMRPPQGRTNAEVTRISRQLGLSQVLWSVTAKDYETTDSALIRQRVLDQTRRDGIIVLHDIYAGTVPAVPGILAELDRRGYTVVTVSQLLAPATPKPGMVYRP